MALSFAVFSARVFFWMQAMNRRFLAVKSDFGSMSVPLLDYFHLFVILAIYGARDPTNTRPERRDCDRDRICWRPVGLLLQILGIF